MNNQPLPERKRLPHQTPAWVPDVARYFITVNCRERGRNQLCQADVGRLCSPVWRFMKHSATGTHGCW